MSAFAERVLANVREETRAEVAYALELAGEPELLEVLKAAHHALTVTHNLRATDLYADNFEAHLNNGVPRDQLEWFIDHTAELDLVSAAIVKAEGRS